MFFYIILFAIVQAIFSPDTYAGDGFGYIVGAGFFFIIGVIFRYYIFSYFIDDVRLAQSLYFYGSIGVVFVLIDIWFTVLFTTADGNVNSGAVQSLAMAFTVIDPTFGWYVIVLFQNNFLGILTQNSGSFWSPAIAGDLLAMLVVSAGLYALLFIVVTENALGGIVNIRYSFSSVKQTVKPLQVEGDESATNTLYPIHTSKDVGYEKNKKRRGSKEEVTTRGVTIDDPDVLSERERVHQISDRGVLSAKESAIFICNLRKVYYARGSVPSKVAVQNINLSIPQGENFGLLGANGAGKTTLLKMVSGLVSIVL